MPPQLSVVIPHYESGGLLRSLLEYLAQQPFNDYELILVNDGGSIPSQREAEDAVTDVFLASSNWPNGGMHLPYLAPASTEFRAGMARNYGALRATAPRLLFLDQDCMPLSICLPVHASYGEAAVVVAGCRWHAQLNDRNIVSQLTPDKRFRLYDEVAINLKSMSAFDTDRYEAIWSCNLSVPTQEFWDIGGFWEEIGGYGGEDQELGRRLQRHGCQLRIDFTAQVWHIDHPRKLGGKEAYQKRCQLIAESETLPVQRVGRFLPPELSH